MPHRWPVSDNGETLGAGLARNPVYAFLTFFLVMITARWERAPSWRKSPLSLPVEPKAHNNSFASSSKFFSEKQLSHRLLRRVRPAMSGMSSSSTFITIIRSGWMPNRVLSINQYTKRIVEIKNARRNYGRYSRQCGQPAARDWPV
jgi:hypothetical protein